MLTFFVFSLALISLGSSNLYTKKPCLNVPSVQNIDMNQMLGVWYEVTRYANDLEQQVRCINATFVHRKDKYMFTINGNQNGKLYTITGPVTIAANHTGILDFHSAMYEKTEAADDVVTRVVVFEPECLVIYYCKYDEIKKLSHVYLWILSRSKSYDGKTKSHVESYLNSAQYLDRSQLVWHDSTDPMCQ